MDAAAFLRAHGLCDTDADAVVSALGAVTAADFALVDAKMARAATKGLKLIPQKKATAALLKAASAHGATLPGLPGLPAHGSVAGAPAADTSAAGASPEDATTTPHPNLEEAIVVCLDHSGSMGAGFSEMRAWCDDGNQNALDKTLEKRSRMDAVKQVFYAFRDRTETLGVGKHQIGLVQFDSKVETLLGLTSSLDLFEAIVDDVEKRGSTAIYSAISEACRMLRPVFDDQPQADLRVLVLTDGQNNTGAAPEMALSDANAIGAVVDAIIVGDTPDTNLRKIVTATGGSCFQITRLSEGFELMESEAVVSLRARRGGGDKPPYSERPWPEGGFQSVKAQTITSAASASTIVRGKAAVAKKMISCRSLLQKNGGKARGKEAGASSSGSAAKKRIMRELAEVAKGSKGIWLLSGEGVHLFPDADNMHLMKALIEGPAGTPFEGGVFALNVSIPSSYPFGAPKISFETPIYHCNVSDTGRICMKMLESDWRPGLSIPKALEAVRNLMAHPDTANALRQWIAELTLMYTRSGGSDTRYVDAARAATKSNAKRSVYGWKVEWGLATDDKE